MAKDMEGGCGTCDKHHMQGMCGQHYWMHVIIKILVALFIFWCGVQFGELKSVIRSAFHTGGYGYGMMSAYGIDRNQNAYYGGPAMMGGWSYSTAAAPATTTKSTKK